MLTGTAFWILTSLADARRHGYEILQDTARLSGGEARLKVATLYAALERLTAQGLVRADGDEVVNGRARRYFVLTDEGARTLDAEVAVLAARARVARGRLAERGSARPALGAGPA